MGDEFLEELLSSQQATSRISPSNYDLIPSMTENLLKRANPEDMHRTWLSLLVPSGCVIFPRAGGLQRGLWVLESTYHGLRGVGLLVVEL